MKTPHANRRIDLLLESYGDWAYGQWVHYSRLPQLTINPNPHHLDLAGIYLFPERFTPSGGWEHYPYRITVRVPSSAKIFDLATLTPPEAIRVAQKAAPVSREDKETIESGGQYWAATFWRHLRTTFAKSRGAWNAFFRNLGYAAVFDDTDTIFSGETQLVLLDPRKAEIVSIDQQGSSGYDVVVQTTERVRKLLAPYGLVQVTPARRGKVGWNEKGVVASLRVDLGDGHYAQWTVETVRSKGDVMPRGIDIHLKYSKPSLLSGWGNTVNFPVPRSGEWALTERQIELAMGYVEDAIQKQAA